MIFSAQYPKASPIVLNEAAPRLRVRIYLNQTSASKEAGVRVNASITIVAAANILNINDDKNRAEKNVIDDMGRVLKYKYQD